MFSLHKIFVIFLSLTPSFVLAAPDAGDILRQQLQPPVTAPSLKPLETSPSPAEETNDTSPKILVQGFYIVGAILIPEAELADQLKNFVGKELSISQLRIATYTLIAYYADKGYLARVVLPEQNIKGGIVTLQVVEGKRGNLSVNSSGRIKTARVERFIDRHLSGGSAFSLTQLDKALNILNEQPGITATTALAPGKNEGEIDVLVQANPKPVLSFNMDINNKGSRSTGELQGSVGVNVSNPTGCFDEAVLTTNFSDGNQYGRLDYSIAAGESGLRIGANTSSLKYRLTQSDFSALQADGVANTLGLTTNYPLIRRGKLNLSLAGRYDIKRLTDYTVAGETSNRRVNVGAFELSGYFVDGGIASFGVGISVGNSDQLNASALNADSMTRQVQGNFSKLSANAGYLLPLTPDWNLNATLRGQYAFKNLDSTERMSLGGSSGVRAYPVGESTGDDAAILSLNFGRKLSSTLSANIFADGGAVHVNHNAWTDWNAANPGLPNTYALAGIGVGLDWRLAPRILINATLAAPLGKNPGRDTNDFNSDGRPNGARGWFSFNAQF